MFRRPQGWHWDGLLGQFPSALKFMLLLLNVALFPDRNVELLLPTVSANPGRKRGKKGVKVRTEAIVMRSRNGCYDELLFRPDQVWILPAACDCSIHLLPQLHQFAKKL